MGETYFTSDLHLNHANIIDYCGRPFRDVEHMNYEIIRRHNERVKDDDTVIYVGDFCFKNGPGGKPGEGGLENSKYWINQLHGQKVFVRGNHDRNNSVHTKIESLTMKIGDDMLWVTHHPHNVNPSYKINLTGHVHEKWRLKCVPSDDFYTSYIVNVGVDVWNFYPVTFREIQRRISMEKEKAFQEYLDYLTLLKDKEFVDETRLWMEGTSGQRSMFWDKQE